jgi:hypothetical protein
VQEGCTCQLHSVTHRLVSHLGTFGLSWPGRQATGRRFIRNNGFRVRRTCQGQLSLDLLAVHLLVPLRAARAAGDNTAVGDDYRLLRSPSIPPPPPPPVRISSAGGRRAHRSLDQPTVGDSDLALRARRREGSPPRCEVREHRTVHDIFHPRRAIRARGLFPCPSRRIEAREWSAREPSQPPRGCFSLRKRETMAWCVVSSTDKDRVCGCPNEYPKGLVDSTHQRAVAAVSLRGLNHLHNIHAALHLPENHVLTIKVRCWHLMGMGKRAHHTTAEDK